MNHPLPSPPRLGGVFVDITWRQVFEVKRGKKCEKGGCKAPLFASSDRRERIAPP